MQQPWERGCPVEARSSEPRWAGPGNGCQETEGGGWLEDGCCEALNG